MREKILEWTESRWWKVTGGCIAVVVLVLCWIGWRGLRQQTATATLQDVYQQAKKEAVYNNNNLISFTISLEGKEQRPYRADYQAAELSDEQFARIKKSSDAWVEQDAKVVENKCVNIDSDAASCDVASEIKEYEQAHVYRIEGRSRYYLLVEDEEEGKEYVAKFRSCYNLSEPSDIIKEILEDFLQIGDAGDISKVTIEDNKLIQEGESNILGVYTEAQDKKSLYENLCGIATPEMIAQAQRIVDEQTEEPEDDGFRYFICLENRQGETFSFGYRPTEQIDYLTVEDYVVPEKQKAFWRAVFQKNARPEDTRPLREVAKISLAEVTQAMFQYPDNCAKNPGTLNYCYYPNIPHTEDIETEDDEHHFAELFEQLLQGAVGLELSDVNKQKTEGACYLYFGDSESEEELGSVDIIKYADYIKIQDNREYPVSKKYYVLTGEMEKIFEQGRKYIEERTEQRAEETEGELLMEKPIIYLYPEKEQDIHVRVKNIELTTVYPIYDNGWNVRAGVDGTLQLYEKDGKTLDRGREYYALYYEGISDLKPDWESGFTVKKGDYQQFLEEKLRVLGLSDRETEEFIVYWLPLMEKYPSVDIHFTPQALLDDIVPLEISPRPDSLIRVFMQWRQHKEGVKLPPQVLAPVARKGYTAVEWGGSEENR